MITPELLEINHKMLTDISNKRKARNLGNKVQKWLENEKALKKEMNRYIGTEEAIRHYTRLKLQQLVNQ